MKITEIIVENDLRQGAKDAIEFYKSVNGDLNKLMQSYDWAWLKSYYTQILSR